MAELTFVRGHTRDLAAVDQFILDMFGVDVGPIAALGLADPTYEAFSYLDKQGALVANAAVFALTLMVGGVVVEAIGLQSVATRPDWRRRGVAQALLRHVLAWCDGQGRPVLLMTDIPAFYAPMGFAVMPQSAFRGQAPCPAPTVQSARRLNLNEGGDLALLTARLKDRVAVSAQFAIMGGAGAFVLALLGPGGLQAWWIDALACLVVTRPCGAGGLHLVDVAGASIPALDTILGALNQAPAWVQTQFPPDRLSWVGAAHPAEGLTLMCRGNLPLPPMVAVPETAWF